MITSYLPTSLLEHRFVAQGTAKELSYHLQTEWSSGALRYDAANSRYLSGGSDR